MWSDQNSTDSEPQLEIDDIQGDILVGLPKDFEWFISFTIENPENFKRFARNSLVTRITSTAEVLAWESAFQTLKGNTQGVKLPLVGLNVAFAKSGLEKLNVPGTIDDDAFNHGQSEKLDGVILITGPTQEAVDRVREELNAHLDGWSVLDEQCGRTRPNHRGHEHFGFLDGISQPAIRGKVDRILPSREFLHLERNPNNPAQGFAGSPLLWPGAFVFGYPSAAKNANEAPDGPGERAEGGPPWTRNGSLMVINRFRQLVPEFNNFIEAKELFAARIVGRWKSGAPLSRAPIRDNSAMGADRLRDNDFDFDGDLLGDRCPVTAHIRKVYPRDSNTTYSHRLIRRGIPFGPEVTAEEEQAGRSSDEASQQRGLMFVCYQTSIKEQFEYVTSLIKDTLNNGASKDALFGHGEHSFIQLTGGGYFFMPSISTFTNIVATDSHLRPQHRSVLLPNGTISPLDFDQTAVEQVFLRLRDLFNSGDYESMRPLLDVNITWKMLHHSDSITDVDAVIHWLKDKKTSLHPQFLPDLHNLKRTVLSGDGSVLISGPADWKANNAREETETIKYYLTFTREGGRWFLSNAFGVQAPSRQGAANARKVLPQIDDVFKQLQGLFNDRKYREMQRLLDSKLTWKMIHHANSITGADLVIQWLEDKKALLNPQFNPVDPPHTAENADHSQRINGSAKWQGRKGSPDENIDYHFTFVNQGNSWLLKDAFAVVVD
jgi:Dyp-type peroxidase family